MADDIHSRRQYLASIPLFKKLPAGAVDRLALGFDVQLALVDGDVVYHQGDEGDRLFVLESGIVDLFHEEASGKVRRLARVKAGGHFGELALLSEDPRTATARCVGNATLLGIRGLEVRRLLAESVPALRSLAGRSKEWVAPEKPLSLWDKLSGSNKARRARRTARSAAPLTRVAEPGPSADVGG